MPPSRPLLIGCVTCVCFLAACGGGGSKDSNTVPTGPTPATPAATTGTLSGKVTDATTASAIAGASVTTLPASGTATTDSQGAFTIANVTPGSYTVQATAATFAGSSSGASVTVVVGQTATANVALAELPYLDLVVNTTADVVNGDVTSTRTLFLNRGPDGVSLREAITAVNNTPGAHTISFSDALVNQVITPTSKFPQITRDSTTISGRFGGDGSPAITLDASLITAGDGPIWVTASAFTLSRMRFIGVHAARAVLFTSGTRFSTAEPQVVSDLVVKDNVFDNRGVAAESPALEFRIEATASGARIRNVTIAHNAFHHFQGDVDCLQLGTDGANNTIQGVTISNNYFSECTYAVELVNGGISSNNRLVGTQILGNYFADGLNQAVSIGNGGNIGDVQARNNVIDSTLIAGNVVVRQTGAGVMPVGGYNGATESAILNTQVFNNLIVNSLTGAAIAIRGGSEGGSASRVQGTRIVNNTFASIAGNGILMVQNLGGSTGNSVADLSISNTLLWANAGDFGGELTPGQVQFSLTSQLGYAGINGNFSADPLFVDAANGDFQLRTGSAAIGAGTLVGAPATDIECRPRNGKPDIGAFQFGSPAVCALPKPFW
jgi:hypothetical protein